MTGHILPWLRLMAVPRDQGGAEVWIADPGRAYLPNAGLLEFGSYTVATTLELEDRITRQTRLLRVVSP